MGLERNIDLAVIDGDLDFSYPYDFGKVFGTKAIASMAKNIVFGTHKNMDIEELLLSQSVRRKSNEEIAQIIKEELQDRLRQSNNIQANLTEIVVGVSKETESYRILLRVRDNSRFISEIAFAGKLTVQAGTIQDLPTEVTT